MGRTKAAHIDEIEGWARKGNPRNSGDMERGVQENHISTVPIFKFPGFLFLTPFRHFAISRFFRSHDLLPHFVISRPSR